MTSWSRLDPIAGLKNCDACLQEATIKVAFGWRAQIQRKGKDVNETFLRRKDAEVWELGNIRQYIGRQILSSAKQRARKERRAILSR